MWDWPESSASDPSLWAQPARLACVLGWQVWRLRAQTASISVSLACKACQESLACELGLWAWPLWAWHCKPGLWSLLIFPTCRKHWLLTTLILESIWLSGPDHGSTITTTIRQGMWIDSERLLWLSNKVIYIETPFHYNFYRITLV